MARPANPPAAGRSCPELATAAPSAAVARVVDRRVVDRRVVGPSAAGSMVADPTAADPTAADPTDCNRSLGTRALDGLRSMESNPLTLCRPAPAGWVPVRGSIVFTGCHQDRMKIVPGVAGSRRHRYSGTTASEFEAMA